MKTKSKPKPTSKNEIENELEHYLREPSAEAGGASFQGVRGGSGGGDYTISDRLAGPGTGTDTRK